MSEVYCPGQSNGIISHINSIKYLDRSSEYGVSPRPLPESTRDDWDVLYFDENFFGSFEGFAKLGQGADKIFILHSPQSVSGLQTLMSSNCEITWG